MEFWNIGFWSVIMDKVFPTVARTMRIGGALVNQLIMAWNCQKDVTLGAAVVNAAVVPLSSSKLELYIAVMFQVDDVVVSLAFSHKVLLGLNDDETLGSVPVTSSRSNCRSRILRPILSITAPQ